ncbi:Sjogren's syndrome/scleroderma autoantigen 1 family protein [Halomontanus rarus]|uniref:Sjogren's syndrome/scleroderma autoantigen 1 family protein n=1 Tax=Halomontanus rarus TaxID=3034020 RepID=UPI001A99037A
MSDFDKEAEREKLREKYERDKADREATQHMSDLLLKGATMTNTHCGVCGDPLFRQDGTTFCPSCHGGPGAVDGQAKAQGQGQGQAQGSVPQQEGANAGAGTPAESGAADAGADTTETADADTAASDRTQDPTASPATDRSSADSSGTQIDVSSPSPDSRSSDPTRPSIPAAGSAPDESTPSQSGTNGMSNAGRPTPPSTANHSSGDLADARAALRETLAYFSQEAAATDDPRYATECLEAAREAAETLSALR